MPPASPKSSVSLGELAVCEDFLDGHREYAIDLLSNIENVAKWHRRERCPETREGRTCTLCELCSADGLMGATRKALETYDDAEKRLKTVRTRLGKNVPNYAAPSRETLFRNSLAKAVFFSIVTAGDSLRSQQAAWQTRLQTDIAKSSLSGQSPQHGPGDSGKKVIEDLLFSAYSGPKIVGPEMNPKLTAVSTGFPETTSSSSMFVIFKRCLSPDCPCELNKANAVANTRLRGTGGSQVASKIAPSLTDFKETRTSKRSKKTNPTFDAQARVKRNAQPSTYHDPNSADAQAPNAPRPQDAMLGPDAQSGSTSETAFLTRETESSLQSPECDALIVDPRVLCLRVQIARCDDARRALMAWCRTWTADLQLGPQEGNGTGPETLLKHESTVNGTREYPLGLAFNVETVEPRKSSCPTGHIGKTTTKGLSHGDETIAQELRFDEQEELERRWLTVRQKRCRDQNRRPRRLDLH